MLVVKNAKRPAILDQTIEAVLDAYDQQVGDAEKRFLQVAGVNRDDPAIEAAYLEAITAADDMWEAVAVACFQVGQLHAQAGGTMPARAAREAMVEVITA